MKPLYAMILIFLLLLSCQNIDIFSQGNVHVVLSDIAHTQTLSPHTYTLFYIKNNMLYSQSHAISHSDESIDISISKIHSIPILACLDLPNISISLDICPFAHGGIYPFDLSDNILKLSSSHKADIAQNILKLHQNKIAIEQINIYKLYKTIEQKTPNAPFDKDRFFAYIIENRLSYWGIKALESISFNFPLQQEEWISTHSWINNINTQKTTIDLYIGKWLFINSQNTAQHAYISVDNEYNVFYQGFD